METGVTKQTVLSAPGSNSSHDPILCLGLRQHWVPISAPPLNDFVTLDTRYIALSLEYLLLYLWGVGKVYETVAIPCYQ